MLQALLEHFATNSTGGTSEDDLHFSSALVRASPSERYALKAYRELKQFILFTVLIPDTGWLVSEIRTTACHCGVLNLELIELGPQILPS